MGLFDFIQLLAQKPKSASNIEVVSISDFNKIKTDTSNLGRLKQNLDSSYTTATTAKKSREKSAVINHEGEKNIIEAEYSASVGSTTRQHATILENINGNITKLEEEKAEITTRKNTLDTEHNEKIAKINQLSNDLMDLKTNKAAAEKIINDKIAEETRFYESESSRLNKQTIILQQKIDKLLEIKALLDAENAKYSVLQGQFNEQKSAETTVKGEITTLGNIKDGLQAEYNIWTSKFTALESEFKEIEEKIAKYLRKGENNLEYLDRLLAEKRDIQNKLFTYTEERYNSQTHLVDDITMDIAPTQILENTQTRELEQNKSKIHNLKNDIMTLSKNIQINYGNSKKKSFFIFLLTQVFVVFFIILLIFILTKKRFI